MSHVFGRNTQTQPPMVAGGEGCYLIDESGKRYFDGSGGAAVSCLGHGDPEVTAAIKAQLDQVAFAHTGFFTSGPAEQLADLLIRSLPGTTFTITEAAFRSTYMIRQAPLAAPTREGST